MLNRGCAKDLASSSSSGDSFEHTIFADFVHLLAARLVIRRRRPQDDIHPAFDFLRVRDVEFRTGLLREGIVMRVRDNANDFTGWRIGIVAIDQHFAAERGSHAAEILPRERFIHDDDKPAIFLIAIVEGSTGQNGNSHRMKIPARDREMRGDRMIPAASGGAPPMVKVEPRLFPEKGSGMAAPTDSTPGSAASFGIKAAKNCSCCSLFGIFRRRQRDADRESPRRIEARLRCAQVSRSS